MKPAKLFNRNFTMMIIGQIISLFGNAILRFALSLYVLDTTGSAAVFGGIGSIPGAFLGGILLGIIESLAKAYISTQLANAILFAVLIVVLLVKPSGLLGKYVPEKV